jgi:hypothetical protein
MRISVLLFVAAITKVLSDLGFGSSGLHRAVRVVMPVALVTALYLLLHPIVVRLLFARSRTGAPVEVRWAGRHRSGQPWLVLHGVDGRSWRVLPRRGPVSYPLPRWRGTPWLEPPPPNVDSVHATLVHPHGTWRRGLVLHAPAGAELTTDDGSDVLPLGTDPHACLGVHLHGVRRLPGSEALDSSPPLSEPTPQESPGTSDAARTVAESQSK